MHPAPLAPRSDDPSPPKIRQVTRDFGLADPQDLHKVADAYLLIGYEVKEAKPRAIRQNAKEAVDGKRFFLPRHGPIIYGLTDMCKVA